MPLRTSSRVKPPASKRHRRIDQLLLRVAQRADELARQQPTGGSAHRDRETWLRAEAETMRPWGTD